MAKMIDCPYCGKLTDPNLGNCPHCGGSLAHKNVVPKRANLGRGRQTCPNCKALVADGDIICVACGTNLLTGQKVTNEAVPEASRSFEMPPPRTLAFAAAGVLGVILLGIWGYYLTRDPKSYAARLIEDGSYIEAMEILDAYVANEADDSEARVTLGQLQYKNNKFGSAATSFEEALRLNPGDIQAAYWGLACVIRAGGDEDYTRRRQLLERIVEMEPANGRAWYLLALARGATGDLDGERRALDRFLSAGGDRELHDWNYGLVSALTGDDSAANDAFEGAIGGTRDADAKAVRAMFAAMRGEIAEAQIALEDAVASDALTIDWEARTELGKLLLARGEFARAIDVLDQAIGANPSNLAGRFFRGVAHSALNQEQQALQDLEYLLNAGRAYAYEAALEAARIQLARNDAGRASDYLNRASRLDAATADYIVLQGRAALGQNNQREAERQYDEAIGLDPNFAEAYLERGLLYIEQDRIEAGISDLQRYVQLVNKDMQGTEVVQIRELIGQLRRTIEGAAAPALPSAEGHE